MKTATLNMQIVAADDGCHSNTTRFSLCVLNISSFKLRKMKEIHLNILIYFIVFIVYF